MLYHKIIAQLFFPALMSERVEKFYDNSSAEIPLSEVKPERNKRYYNRTQCKVKINIRNKRTSWVLVAQCSDISPEGIKVEFTNNVGIKLAPFEIVEVWMHLPNRSKSIHRTGWLVWLTRGTFYQGGIRFKSAKPPTINP
jgi:hypothetical protein